MRSPFETNILKLIQFGQSLTFPPCLVLEGSLCRKVRFETFVEEHPIDDGGEDPEAYMERRVDANL